ncbi:hypothetical protein IE077_000972 [Cardiosporidium cionae]|uniref:Uncharacterized protein n=1 Tax=Cardiosporidium cionae TaxID=476202 RepID=A0ABQ7JGM4_9APIC|nr:hypothetical protein IE077_000972 [Cardiosporidium cionae]|eukprot:KAF8823050.1 hypothetical protein IE077_000972 [Cardiosporidium cionae]
MDATKPCFNASRSIETTHTPFRGSNKALLFDDSINNFTGLSKAIAAVSDLGLQVKLGSEQIWNSALVTAGCFTGGSVNGKMGSLISDRDTAVALNHTKSHTKYWGEGNFELTLQLADQQGQETGMILAEIVPLSQGSQLFKDEMRVCIPANYTWYKMLRENVKIPVAISNEKYYQLSADDIGCTILVKVTPKALPGGYYHGIKYGKIGPFELDQRSREILSNGIRCGSMRFPCKQVKDMSVLFDATFANMNGEWTHDNDTENNFRRLPKFDASLHGFNSENITSVDAVIHIMLDSLKIFHPGTEENSYNKVVECKYCGNYPSVEIPHDDFNIFRIKVGKKAEDRWYFKAFNRHQRDLITLAIRCFHARTHICNSITMDKVLAHSDYKADGTFEDNTKIEMMCLIQSLSELLFCSSENEKRYLMYNKYIIKEKDALEKDLLTTIEAFQEYSHTKQLDRSMQSSSLDESIFLQSLSNEGQLFVQTYKDQICLLHKEKKLLEMKLSTNEKHRKYLTDEGSKTTENKSKKMTALMSDSSENYLQEEIMRLQNEIENLHYEKEKSIAKIKNLQQEQDEIIKKKDEEVFIITSNASKLREEKLLLKLAGEKTEKSLNEMGAKLESCQFECQKLQNSMATASKIAEDQITELEQKINAAVKKEEVFLIEKKRLNNHVQSLKESFEKSMEIRKSQSICYSEKIQR